MPDLLNRTLIQIVGGRESGLNMLGRLIPICFLFLLSGLSPAGAQDASEAIVRLNRVENQMRQMVGQIEQLQFENRQLKEQLRRLEEGVSPGSATSLPAKPKPPAAASVPASAVKPGVTPQKRSDAFDPSQQPGAPGAPMPLGSTVPSPALSDIDQQQAAPSYRVPEGALPDHAVPGSNENIVAEDQPSSATRIPGPSVAATGSGDPRIDYDEAYASFSAKRYSDAEMGFRSFLQSHPRDRLVPDAMYWLGESYLASNRPREAAEQFLNVTSDHSASAIAPNAMLKLGVSLNAIGAQDRACAVFAELARKYPQASANFKAETGREQRRAGCP